VTEFLRLLGEWLQYLFPLRRVDPWESGVCLVFGRYWRTVGPGVYLVLPWFADVVTVNVVPGVYMTPLQTVTLRDGTALTFSAAIEVQVEDARLAHCTIEAYTETVTEQARGLLAERLADVDPARFDPARGKRDRLMGELLEELNETTLGYGVRVRRLWFPDWALGVRTIRLLGAPVL
jgi:regulator of protease activity HflC (stomatin/prohibitin superfamily)